MYIIFIIYLSLVIYMYLLIKIIQIKKNSCNKTVIWQIQTHLNAV